MRNFFQYLALGLSLILSPALSNSAEMPSYDTCVQSLYGLGGVGLNVSQRLCVPGIAQSVLDCQRVGFFFGQKDPLPALQDCQATKQQVDISSHHFPTGTFQESTQQQDKLNVCSITVNSSDERDAFRSQLDPNKYTWTELLPRPDKAHFIPRDDYWLQRACKNQIRCDILVISGHFAAT